MPKVSFIVPVYNAEKYLARCVDSIIKQTYTDWELILVDDGSPDNSGLICDEYASKDLRIRVFHKENGGVSSARNLGLDVAISDWLCFVDADDEISERTIEECLGREETKIDIIQFSYSRNRECLNQGTDDDCTPKTWQEYIGERNFSTCVGGTLLRSDMIKINSIRFDESMKLAEDQIFMLTCFVHSQKIVKVNRILYYYYDNDSSATHNEKAEDIILSIRKCIAFKGDYPIFAFRMDDLVLYFIEKLILQGKYEECKELLRELNPTYISRRGIVTRLMVFLSRINENMAIYFERIFYPIYNRVTFMLSKNWNYV